MTNKDKIKMKLCIALIGLEKAYREDSQCDLKMSINEERVNGKVNDRLFELREAFEDKRLNIIVGVKQNRFQYDFGEKENRVNTEMKITKLSGDEVGVFERFEYLGTILQKYGGFNEDI